MYGICTDHGCNKEAIDFTNQSQFSFRRREINEHISHNVGHCLLYGPKFSFA
jgi:hypothetical protein